MRYYKNTNNGKLTCILCNHYCSLKEGQAGICGVNKNIDNKISCLVYGYPQAMHIDPIEKKPLYHFLQGTNTFSIGTVGCNFKCSFCQNWKISQNNNINKKQYYSPKDIVELAISNGCKSISYTYNEPTIFFPYIYDIAIIAKKNGLKNIMVTNGYESKEISKQIIGLIDAVNVDLKSFNSKYYKVELGGKLDRILDNLITYVNNNIHVEITTLIVPTKNDKNSEIKDIASFISKKLNTKVPWHISAFRPEYKELNLKNTSIQSLIKAYQIGEYYGLENIHIGNLKRKIIKKDLVVNGQFYPNSKHSIAKFIQGYNPKRQLLDFIPRAIIVPHAGYVYSGYTANEGYKIIPKNIETVVVIGPSHKFNFKGASVLLCDIYPTPLGFLGVDLELANTIIDKYKFINFVSKVHVEHSVETQMPFIKYYLPNAQVVELVYADISYQDLALVIKDLISQKDIFIVISTDLSHFYNLNEANIIDQSCIDGILNQDLLNSNNICEACGITGVKAMINYAKNKNLKSKLLDYKTSANTTNDISKVVGYASFAFGDS